jgi:hypothetical protein
MAGYESQVKHTIYLDYAAINFYHDKSKKTRPDNYVFKIYV